MPNTTPDNISYPDNTSPKKTIEGHLEDIASSVQSAFTSKRINSKDNSYSLQATDSNSVIVFSNVTPVTLTIDDVLPVGASVEVLQDSTAQVTFAAGSGVTLLSGNGYGTKFQYARALVFCISPGKYRVTGDIRKVVSASGGNSTTSDSLYRYHTFTANGSFTVSGATGVVCDLLIVGGGGGGGGGERQNGQGGGGGGGGAGGFISVESVLLAPNSYQIVIGGGGAGGASGDQASSLNGSNGTNTTAFGYTALGGGYGGADDTDQAGDGGSGGGGGGDSPNGNIGVATIPAQGNHGASGSGSNRSGGGGGGAGSNGDAAQSTLRAGHGGGGRVWLNGSVYAGGGGAGPGGSDQASFPGYGGTGGGGAGSRNGGNGGFAGYTATAGTANTGGGGGGAGAGNNAGGASGGSGIVIIRYLRTEVE